MPTTINGTTGINLLQSGVVQQASLAANVVGNAPVFSARLGTNQTAVNGGWTRINLDVVEFDTNSFFSSYRFQPSISGYYQLNANTYLVNSATTVIASFWKNGVEVRRGTQAGSGTTTGWGAVASTIIYLNGTDYVELYGYQNGASNSWSAGSYLNYFNGFLVRAA